MAASIEGAGTSGIGSSGFGSSGFDSGGSGDSARIPLNWGQGSEAAPAAGRTPDDFSSGQPAPTGGSGQPSGGQPGGGKPAESGNDPNALLEMLKKMIEQMGGQGGSGMPGGQPAAAAAPDSTPQAAA